MELNKSQWKLRSWFINILKLKISISNPFSFNILFIYIAWMMNYNIAQTVKNLPSMQETWVRFLGREDHLEKEMATHSSILVWEIPWTEEPSRLQFMGSDRTWRLTQTICCSLELAFPRRPLVTQMILNCLFLLRLLLSWSSKLPSGLSSFQPEKLPLVFFRYFSAGDKFF